MPEKQRPLLSAGPNTQVAYREAIKLLRVAPSYPGKSELPEVSAPGHGVLRFTNSIGISILRPLAAKHQRHDPRTIHRHLERQQAY